MYFQVGGCDRDRIAQWLAAAGIAGVHRERTSGDLHPKSVPGGESMRSRPEIKFNPVGRGLLLHLLTQEPLAYIHRSPVGIHVAQPYKQIEVANVGLDIDPRADGAAIPQPLTGPRQ